MAVGTVTQEKKPTIQYVHPRDLRPHPVAVSIPMSETDAQSLRTGIAKAGYVQTPLHTTPDGCILDGVHRWRFAQELNITSLPVTVFRYEHKAEESIHALNANIERRHINEGQKAILLLELEGFQQELAKLEQEALTRKQQKSKETSSHQERGASGRFGQTQKEDTVLVPQGTNTVKDQGKSVAKAATSKGSSPRTMYRAKAVAKDPQRKEAVKQGTMSLTKAYQEVKAEEQMQEVKQLQTQDRQLTDLEIMKTLDITVQPYDVWNFPKCDDRFGRDYPGRIPGQLIAHCLYFWTEQGDMVLDPMAGSGTTIDVCKALNRQVLAYDAHPCRDDIALHNLDTQGWPERTADAKLIFWDPPYFKKKDDGYGEHSISRYGCDAYLAFFERMARTIPDEFQGRLAFLMSDYTDEENSTQSIWFTDYVHIFISQGWKIERYIQTPLTTQSVHADIVKKFRESKRLARLGRVLAVMSK